ncbi:transcription factor 20 isoform X2 [Protopterus annectens]|uniref:transcription factor 20 isoform X2 n=1 Tax=Protopterus annectens TaxID=7888 RepID=UPI001CF94EFF|nr:transcription factor 20 isoform X2 [Protopterus annectens]
MKMMKRKERKKNSNSAETVFATVGTHSSCPSHKISREANFPFSQQLLQLSHLSTEFASLTDSKPKIKKTKCEAEVHPNTMQSFREQSSYGNQQNYQQEMLGSARMEDFSPHQQSSMFANYTGRRGPATASGVTGEGCGSQAYQSYRKEAGDYYFLAGKEVSGQPTQRRPSGPIQSYGPPQGSSYTGQYSSEGRLSQFQSPHSAISSMPQFQQDHYNSTFSPGSSQYPQQVTSHQQQQQLIQPVRHQTYQTHQPLPQQQQSSQSSATPQIQQHQRASALTSSGYQHRVAHFSQHFQPSAASSAYSSPQRYTQSGTSFDGYSVNASSAFDSHVSGSNTQTYGTSSGYSFQPQHLKSYEQSKVSQSQQSAQHTLQYSNPSKVTLPSQTGQYTQSEVSVKSPMQFHQNFSPISNPSPAASVVQSPSCSSTPSPLMSGSDTLPCGQSNMPLGSRNRVVQMMPQLSPTTSVMTSSSLQAGGYKNFGLEALQEKRLSDPGLSSLSALSSQVANIPHTVQHMLLTDTLASGRKHSKRTSKKVDSSTNSEGSSQAEEQLKSPQAESVDGGCSSSSEDPAERMRQLSGQSTCSDTAFKTASSEKSNTSPPPSSQSEPPKVDPNSSCKEEVSAHEAKEEEPMPEVPKVNEKSVGVIVSRESMTVRSEKGLQDSRPPHDTVPPLQTPSAITGSKGPPSEPLGPLSVSSPVASNSTSHNGEGLVHMTHSVLSSSFPKRIEVSKASASLTYGAVNIASKNSEGFQHINTHPSSQDKSSFVSGAERKTPLNRAEKFPSLLQEVLQGYHPDRRYARGIQEPLQMVGNLEGSVRPNVLVNQKSDHISKTSVSKNLTPYLDYSAWGPWDKKTSSLSSEVKQINLADYVMSRKFEAESQSAMHEPGVTVSERRSVICDVSPSRQLTREHGSHAASLLSLMQERGTDSRTVWSERLNPTPVQSVILPGGQTVADPKAKGQVGPVKNDDLEQSQCSVGLNNKKNSEAAHFYSTTKQDSVKNNFPNMGPSELAVDYSQDFRSLSFRRGGRVGPRGKSPPHVQEPGERLKTPPLQFKGTPVPVQFSSQASPSAHLNRAAVFSTFASNSEIQSLVPAYQMNTRLSALGDLSLGVNSLFSLRRQAYQHEEQKERTAGANHGVISAAQVRQEGLVKSPRQEQFHERVKSPSKNDRNTTLLNQSSTYPEVASAEAGWPTTAGECNMPNVSVDSRLHPQKSTQQEKGWDLSGQVSPKKGGVPPDLLSQKRCEPKSENDRQPVVTSDPLQFAKLGNSMPKLTGQEEQSHQNPLIMRRRVRSFISPIPVKRQQQETKSNEVEDKVHILPSATGEANSTSESSVNPLQTSEPNKLSPKRDAIEVLSPDDRSSTSVSLTSPAKTKILPPRKGRGLKLEAIVQKITSPNVRKSTASSVEGGADSVTLDEILSFRGAQLDSDLSVQVVEGENKKAVSEILADSSVAINQESASEVCPLQTSEGKHNRTDELTKGDYVPDALEACSESYKTSSPLEISSGNQGRLENSLPTPASGGLVESRRNASPQQVLSPDIESRANSHEMGRVSTTLKQDVIPPKGYFPSGKKRGRPVGSVNKQKRQPPSDESRDSDHKPKKQKSERKRASGTQQRRRRRQNNQTEFLIQPSEPEIKLKYASQSSDKGDVKNKLFIPYVHVERNVDIGELCTIVNAEDEEQGKVLKSRKIPQRSSSPPPDTKALPASSFVLPGPIVTESSVVGRLVCCLCGKWANYKNLGDLFGPYYPPDYAATLPKNPPPKKSSEIQGHVKVRHKSASDGSKTDSEEEMKEQRSLTTHPRFKRRLRPEDAASRSVLRGSTCKAPLESCEKTSLDLKAQVCGTEPIPETDLKIPELPLDSSEFWVHEACILWANGVYLVCGKLYGLLEAVDVAREMKCSHCQEPGATLGCYSKGCTFRYHYMCAIDADCLLNEENFSMRCSKHKVELQR